MPAVLQDVIYRFSQSLHNCTRRKVQRCWRDTMAAAAICELPSRHGYCAVLLAMMARKTRMRAGRVSTEARYCQNRMVLISLSPQLYSTHSVCRRAGR